MEERSSQQSLEHPEYSLPNEDAKSKQERANKFKSLASRIESSTKTVENLMRSGKKQRYGAHTYVIFIEEQDAEFHNALGEINKLIAEAQTMLDSYIELDKSTPKFENYLNLFYNMYEENITRHSQTMFFIVHARDENLYLYPYFGLSAGHFGFNKLSMLLARIRGTLEKCGDYIIDEPPAPAPRPDMYGRYGGDYSRQYYPSSPYRDWREEWDRERWDRERRAERREPRDIGDAQEQR